MTTQSAKAKGRRLQQQAAKDLLALDSSLQPNDIQSRSMGAAGVDLILSPAAEASFGPLLIECKNQESLNVMATMREHVDKYKQSAGVPLLIHKKNGSPILVTMLWDDYLVMLKKEQMNAKS